MRTHKLTMMALLMIAGVWGVLPFGVAGAADGDQYVGTWKGAWEGGGGSGRFDLTFARGSDGKIVASVSVGSEMGDYNAKFSTVTVNADKLAGAYDFPPDPQGEITIAGTFDAKNASGTWSLAAKGQPGSPGFAGSWKVSKQ
jgi:hypothetical protein